MLVDTAAGLTDALRRHRLLEPAQLAELDRLQAAFPVPRALAGELIRLAWLTPYQVNKLLQDRGRELLLGSYVLMERLGEGGMGEVFKARNWKLGQIVALKLIRKERIDNPDAVRRFQREIRAAAQLDHPNIVRAFDADEVGGTHLLVMEFVQGTDLSKLVKKDGPLPIEKACDYARQAALGLQHAFERGLVHRDIKPHNLLLTPQGVVKILDMGLARLDRGADDGASSTMTREGAVMGTLDYISPEQAMDSHDVDIRADLYSLGCTLYFLLTGKVPFPGGEALQKLLKHRLDEPVPVEQLRREVSPGVAAVVRKLMAKRPDDRYQTPAEAAAALAHAADAKGRTDEKEASISATQMVSAAPGATPDATAGWSSVADARPDAAPLRRRRTAPDRPWVWVGAAIGVLVLVLGLTGLFRFLPRGSNPPPPTSGARPDPPQAAPAEITNSIGMKLKLIKPGKFTMGSPKDEEGRDDNEGPQHEVEITKVFYMGACPVTKGQFAAFVQDSAYQTDAEKDGKGGWLLNMATYKFEQKPEYTWRHPGFSQGDDHPVVDISWHDATAFCAWLSKKEGKTYELPTEAEWEYACRAGTTTRFWCGDTDDSLQGNANIPDASLKAKFPDYKGAVAWDDGYAFTSPVDAFKANPWGLYDMHGNVWQWCADGYDTFQEGSIKDPKGKESAKSRVFRGGTWSAPPHNWARSAHRRHFDPADRAGDGGSRVVLRPTAPEAKRDEPVDAAAADFDKWIQEVSTLSPWKQTGWVAAKLKERNPDFDGKVTPTIDNGVVTGLEFVTDKVTDLSPVRALTGLKILRCEGSGYGKGCLIDLALLKGMNLAGLYCNYNKISDLSPLKGMPLTALGCDGNQISNLGPLAGMELTFLNCGGNPITNLSPLKGMPLKTLWCHYSGVSDLTPLKGMPLTELWCHTTGITDLSPLKDMKLTYLMCHQAQVTDLSPLRGMPLQQIVCDFRPLRDAEILHSFKGLQQINGQWFTDFWKDVDKKQAAFETWCKEVATQPAEKQWQAVAAKLKELNSDFDGTVKPTVEGGVVTGLEFLTDNVTDLSPVRALTGLNSLNCGGSAIGKGHLSDLSPLKDIKLTWLYCNRTKVSNLTPLKDMRLMSLDCGGTAVSDLSPLKDMKLMYLSCMDTRVIDLLPLKGMGLTYLNCAGTQVPDLSPLTNMKLTWLHCERTQVTDLSPLRGMPLGELSCDFQAKRDAEILRSIKTLQQINGQPGADFWKAVGDAPPKP